MKRRSKGYDMFTEHYLVPAALSLLNINVVHLIQAYVNGNDNDSAYLAALTIAFIALSSALLFKNQLYLWSAMAYYGLIVFVYLL
ncbi:hypothetical protein SAMN05421747_13112 [Parapedobacter composti]|uniref:Uncharacterized protein n=1 Tax=Parapedobacter composti TaxID=623281 RepID=A0A1I1MHJ4_9SPHI|nr:hypothetical protein [Parapedobacter composti]SFC82113.1 hypothetical protein SAMN05421747_13112 [Parapedobacter composti]